MKELKIELIIKCKKEVDSPELLKDNILALTSEVRPDLVVEGLNITTCDIIEIDGQLK